MSDDQSFTKSRKKRYAAEAAAVNSMVPASPNQVAAETTGSSRTNQ